MAASGGHLSTFGEKPKKFQIEDGGEFYMIGSEVVLNILYTAVFVLSRVVVKK